MLGIISGIIDLGLQPMDDGHRKSDIPLEEEEAYLLEHPTNYFKTLKMLVQRKPNVMCSGHRKLNEL